jgi:hypothetical protein
LPSDPEREGTAARLWRLRWWVMGIIGWLMLAASYPFDWRLPVYAGF